MRKNPPDAESRVVKTLSETFADGSAIEAVTSTMSGAVDLLLFRDAARKTIACQVEHEGRIYRPLELEETIRRATRFPHDAKTYGSPGKLFRRISQVIEMHSGLIEYEASLIAAWVASSWIADFLPSAPTLFVSGSEMSRAIVLFRLLHCLCRRAVLLGDLDRRSFLSLAPLAPTLLVNQPSLPPKMRDLWANSNFRGVHIL
jgi:hypothetical protein